VNAAVARPGVTRRVGDSFPRDVVGGDLYCRGQWRQLLGCIDRDAHPVFVLRRALLRVVVDRRHEAELIEGRGAQVGLRRTRFWGIRFAYRVSRYVDPSGLLRT
jgi:hypothetical protein